MEGAARTELLEEYLSRKNSPGKDWFDVHEKVAHQCSKSFKHTTRSVLAWFWHPKPLRDRIFYPIDPPVI